MPSAIQMLLAGTPVDKTGQGYRTYRAGLLLSARIRSALWLLRDHPDVLIRTHLRETRRALARRADARASAFGTHCSRMEPTVAREDLDALRVQHSDPRDQAYALISEPIPDLDENDRLAQVEAGIFVRSVDAGGTR